MYLVGRCPIVQWSLVLLAVIVQWAIILQSLNIQRVKVERTRLNTIGYMYLTHGLYNRLMELYYGPMGKDYPSNYCPMDKDPRLTLVKVLVKVSN
jgi:hypothetical protein